MPVPNNSDADGEYYTQHNHNFTKISRSENFTKIDLDICNLDFHKRQQKTTIADVVGNLMQYLKMAAKP